MEFKISDYQMPTNIEQKHSEMGIASFIISITVGILTLIAIVVAVVIQESTPGGLDEESVGAIILGGSILGLIFDDLLALGLGIAGLLQKDRKKIFATLGTIFSSVIILLMVMLIIVGIMVE